VALAASASSALANARISLCLSLFGIFGSPYSTAARTDRDVVDDENPLEANRRLMDVDGL
jgi:hypothetical protein